MQNHSESSFQIFWNSYPALFYGIAFLAGICFYQSPSYALSILIFGWLVSYLLPFFNLKNSLRAALAIFLLFAAYLYASLTTSYPDLPVEGINGKALVEIEQLSKKDSFIGKRWLFVAKVKEFHRTADGPLYNIPVTIALNAKKNFSRPLANRSYEIYGKLKKTEDGKYFLIPDLKEPWMPTKKTYNLSEERLTVKNWINSHLRSKIQNENAQAFLSGIVTGDFENRLLSYQFSRFGLQHIMAISGFHFSIIAAILAFSLSLFFQQKTTSLILIFSLTSYFVFLGPSPSILRAWICCMIAFFSYFFQKSPSALNSLGIALMAILIFNPVLTSNLGFQYSFSVTASILIFYKPFNQFLQSFLPKRKLQDVIEMNELNKWGFIVISLFRQALALTLAVNIVALPLTLHYFGNFPLLSLLYNLFFPWFVSLIMLILIVSLFFDVLQIPMSDYLHNFNNTLTQFVLDYAYRLPRNYDYNLQLSLDANITFLLVGSIFLVGIFLNYSLENEAFSFENGYL